MEGSGLATKFEGTRENDNSQKRKLAVPPQQLSRAQGIAMLRPVSKANKVAQQACNIQYSVQRGRRILPATVLPTFAIIKPPFGYDHTCLSLYD